MTSRPPNSDLEPADRQLAERLADERPVPAAEFRGVLGRHLAARDPGYGPRPARLTAIAGAYLGVGCGIGAVGALVAAGVL